MTAKIENFTTNTADCGESLWSAHVASGIFTHGFIVTPNGVVSVYSELVWCIDIPHKGMTRLVIVVGSDIKNRAIESFYSHDRLIDLAYDFAAEMNRD